MTIGIAFLLLVSTLLGGFVALNWAEFFAPTTLSLGFTTMLAPLGLVMLGVLILVAGLFALYVLYLHAAELVRTRRLLKEMESQRQLVDQSESSRFTELRTFVETQFALQRQRDAQTLAAVQSVSPFNRQDEKVWLQELHNGLSAQLGQMEDRLDRLLPPTDANRPELPRQPAATPFAERL